LYYFRSVSNKSQFIWQSIIQKAVLTGKLPFNLPSTGTNQLLILRVQKAKDYQERLYRVNLCKQTVKIVRATCFSILLVFSRLCRQCDVSSVEKGIGSEAGITGQYSATL
jgi:hypothetical protein